MKTDQIFNSYITSINYWIVMLVIGKRLPHVVICKLKLIDYQQQIKY